jgi:hypothetical protein
MLAHKTLRINTKDAYCNRIITIETEIPPYNYTVVMYSYTTPKTIDLDSKHKAENQGFATIEEAQNFFAHKLQESLNFGYLPL